MRIEIIEAKHVSDLERRVNYALSKYKNDDILDIKYYINGNGSRCSSKEYSAMIIYKN